MVHLFKRCYSWDFDHLTSRNTSTGKRKRDADESLNSFNNSSSRVVAHPQRRSSDDSIEIEHSIANAIVLLVMDLGKICAYKGPLPACPQAASTTISTTQDHCSDSRISLASTSNSSAQGYNGRFIKVKAAIASPTDLRGKNIDVIPGLAYYIQDADIIGELPRGEFSVACPGQHFSWLVYGSTGSNRGSAFLFLQRITRMHDFDRFE
jgi:hypothetical protein